MATSRAHSTLFTAVSCVDTLRADDRSLTSEEADADVKAVLELLEQELGAVLR